MARSCPRPASPRWTVAAIWCAAKVAVERGELGAAHLRNYQKLRKESEFHDLSQQERRKKDRAFGRFMHNYKKQRD